MSLSPNGEPYLGRLVIVGCVHAGSKHADMKDLKPYLKLADRCPKTKFLVLGDLFENAIPARGEGMSFEQNRTPDEQMDDIEGAFQPYKARIIGACTSNHSMRTWKEVGIDLDANLYKRLGIPNVYQGLQGVVMFMGKKIAFAHGNGSGDNWNDAKKLYTIYPDADIIATSHRHEMTSKWHGNFKINARGDRLKKHPLFVRTGGLMNWANYAQAELYSPQKPGFSIIYVLANGKIEVNTNGL